jgi:ribonuclease E
LRDAVRQDRARIQIGRISRFGLLELSRQRLRPSIGESASIACPRCSGMGTIRSVDSLALALLRLIGEEARKDRTVKVIAQLPVEVATYLMNEKRDWLNGIETKSGTQVVLVPNKYMETPAYEIRRVRDDEAGLPENSAISHQIPVAPATAVNEVVKEDRPAPPAPLVVASSIATIPPPTTIAMETTIAPVKPPAPVEQLGIFVRAWRFFFGGAGTAPKEAPTPAPRDAGRPAHEGRRDRHEGRHGRDRDRDRHGRHQRGDRDRGRHEHKDKAASGGEGRRDGRRDGHRDGQQRDGQRHERKHREHSDAARAPAPQPQQQQQQQQQPAAPKPEAAPPQSAEAGRNNERGDRGDRGDRRPGRRGRRRRGGRGRSGEGAAADAGAANSSEARPESAGDSQHSLDLAAPRAEQPRVEHAADAPPPRQERSEPAGDSGPGESKSYTVWSGGPTPSSGSWGGGGSRREE